MVLRIEIGKGAKSRQAVQDLKNKALFHNYIPPDRYQSAGLYPEPSRHAGSRHLGIFSLANGMSEKTDMPEKRRKSENNLEIQRMEAFRKSITNAIGIIDEKIFFKQLTIIRYNRRIAVVTESLLRGIREGTKRDTPHTLHI